MSDAVLGALVTVVVLAMGALMLFGGVAIWFLKPAPVRDPTELQDAYNDQQRIERRRRPWGLVWITLALLMVGIQCAAIARFPRGVPDATAVWLYPIVGSCFGGGVIALFAGLMRNERRQKALDPTPAPLVDDPLVPADDEGNARTPLPADHRLFVLAVAAAERAGRKATGVSFVASPSYEPVFHPDGRVDLPSALIRRATDDEIEVALHRAASFANSPHHGPERRAWRWRVVGWVLFWAVVVVASRALLGPGAVLEVVRLFAQIVMVVAGALGLGRIRARYRRPAHLAADWYAAEAVGDPERVIALIRKIDAWKQTPFIQLPESARWTAIPDVATRVEALAALPKCERPMSRSDFVARNEPRPEGTRAYVHVGGTPGAP